MSSSHPIAGTPCCSAPAGNVSAIPHRCSDQCRVCSQTHSAPSAPQRLPPSTPPARGSRRGPWPHAAAGRVAAPPLHPPTACRRRRAGAAACRPWRSPGLTACRAAKGRQAWLMVPAESGQQAQQLHVLRLSQQRHLRCANAVPLPKHPPAAALPQLRRGVQSQQRLQWHRRRTATAAATGGRPERGRCLSFLGTQAPRYRQQRRNHATAVRNSVDSKCECRMH